MTERKRPSADWAGASERYSSTRFGDAEWLAIMDAQPDIFHRLVGDMCKAVVATESDVRRTGRRPAPSLSLADVDRILSPRYSQDAFPVALAELMAGRSQRAFATRVPVHHHTLRRLLRGETPPSKAMLESLAKAGRVEPHYFREWRAMELADVMTAHFELHPNDSIGHYKQLRRVTAAR